MNYLDQKRRLSVAERQRLALLWAAILTVVIILLWLGWLGFKAWLVAPSAAINSPGPVTLILEILERISRGVENIYGWFK